MNVKLLFFLAIVALSSFFYLYIENPGNVTVILSSDYSYTFPLVLVLFLSFLVGVFMMGIDSVISDTMRSLRSKKAKKVARAIEDANKTYREGLEAMARAEYKSAREHIEKALLTLPGDLPMTLSLAETHGREGHPHEAVDALDTELFHNPTSIVILTAIGSYAKKACEAERAARAFEEVLKLDNSNLHAMKELRDIKIGEGLWSEAVELEQSIVGGHKKGWFRSGGHDNGKIPGLLYEQARSQYETGDMDGAEATLKEALKKDDAFTPAQMLFGDIYKEKYGDYEALMVWEKAYSRAPGNAALLFRIEDYRIGESAPDKMIDLYKKELADRPDDINLRLLLARFYLRVEMVERAVDELEGLHGAGKECYYSKILLATAYSKQGYENRAAEMLGDAIGIDGVKTNPAFTCSHCSTTFRQWAGRCGFCGEWNTLHMNPEAI